MSQAGARSERGDEYQLRVAVPWLVRLWTDPSVVAVQTESLGMPGDGTPPLVDDVVVEFAGGERLYVQAKKNHPDFGTWSIADREMKEELLKARDQLEADPTGEVRFVSRSPFGALHKLAEGARDYPDGGLFEADAPTSLCRPMAALARLWERDETVTFDLVRRLFFTVTGDYDEMDRDALALLRMLFARPEEVHRLLEERLRSHQSRLRRSVAEYRREELERELADAGHVPSPERAVEDQLAAFRRASSIGREWGRTLAGERIPRPETDEVLRAVDEGRRTVLVTGGPGVGKTCVLLDVADALEARPDVALLFIKGDQFGGALDASGLVELGLPDDIVGRCARLSVHLPVVVVLDALDVLSIQRASGALSLFVGLLDRLSSLENVTVVAACRPYDLDYDPLLRGRAWGAKVTVGPLSVEGGVCPVLVRWGVDPDGLDDYLLELLRVPARLWLYGEVIRDGPVVRVGSVYELHDRYLESVRSEPEWGEATTQVLANVAAQMQAARSQTVSRADVVADREVIHGLLSRGVLIRTERGYAFGHQELLDVVAVRAAQREGQTLRTYVRSQPALPFIRPTVRVFMEVLRAEDPTGYRRQVWHVLNDAEVPYHLRRLVAESAAEGEPRPGDAVLATRLMRAHPDLFERFLQRAVGGGWLAVVTDDLLPAVERGGDVELRERLLRGLAAWAVRCPDVVVPVWRWAVEAGVEETGLGWTLANGLEAVLRGSDPAVVPDEDVRALLELMMDRLELSRHASHALGSTVQAWVETRGGHDLLLRFLIEEGALEPAEVGKRARSLRRRGEPSQMPVDFLAEQLGTSDAFLDAVLTHLVRTFTTETERPRIWGGLLGQTSWRARHNRGMMGHEPLHDLVASLEAAVLSRVQRRDDWWEAHRDELSRHPLPGIRYLVLRAYRDDPVPHVDAISELLRDASWFEMSDLRSELRELAHAVYPSLPQEVARAHQARLLLEATEVPDDAEPWYVRACRRSTCIELAWIPKPYLIPEAQAFLEDASAEFGLERLGPRIHSYGAHFVPSPVSGETLGELSVAGVVRVAQVWRPAPDGGDTPSDWELVPRALADAAMRAPERAFQWVPALIDGGARPEYLNGCVEGIARYLRIRNGNYSVNGVKDVPASPMGDETVGQRLLRLCELYGETWMEERVLSEAVYASQKVLADETSAARVTLLLVRLSRSWDPGPDTHGWPDLETEAMNATRGETATTAVELAHQLRERGSPLPPLLEPLLRTLAMDERPSVRLALVARLAPLTHSDPGLGWDLVELATRSAPREVWVAVESSLYYSYHESERVEPSLDRIRDTALDEAGDVYGRIGALRVLAGTMNDDAFFEVVEAGSTSVSEGAAHVFATNLDAGDVGARCADALVRLLGHPHASVGAVGHVAMAMSRGGSRPFPRRVVEALLRAEPEDEEHSMRLHAVGGWIVEEAAYDPLVALDLLEDVAAGVEAGRLRGGYGGGELATALNAVLREVDELDDGALIQRAVLLQDRFLRLGYHGVDRMLDEASRA